MKAGSLLRATLHQEAEDHPEELAEAWAAPPPGITELAWYEGASLWLYRRLATLGLRDGVAGPIREALRLQVLGVAGINLRIDEAARQVLQLLGRAGIPVVALKGIARRALASRWPLLDARPVSDVDLLLSPDEVVPAWEFLRGQGYTLALPGSEQRYTDHHHLPGLIGPGGGAIELHRSTSLTLGPSEAWARLRGDAETVQWQGIEILVPSPTELVWHSISHAATDGVLGFRIRHWLDLVGLLTAGAPVDWDAIGQRIIAEPVPDALTLKPVNPTVLRQWLGGAAELLAKSTTAEWRHLATPVDLERLLNGRARPLISKPP